MPFFDVYKMSELQNFIAISTQFESEGIMDVRFIREQLLNHINSNMVSSRLMAKRRFKEEQNERDACPSCGKKTLKPARNFKGVSCKCGYSKMDGVK